MPSLKFSVFISSTSEDLQPFREATERGILGLKELYPIDMKHFSPTADNALQVCYDAVQSADMFVGIYALRYGYTPDSSVTYKDKNGVIRHGDGKTSITEWEYQWAIEKGIPLLLFVLDKDASWDYRLVQADKSDQMKAFKDHIGDKHTLKFFKDIAEYAQAVVIAMNHAYGKILAERMSIRPTPDQIKAQEQHALASSITPPPSQTKEKIRRVGTLPKLFTDEHFYDRANEQAEITNAIRDYKPLIVIRGRGGIGKTALACKVLGDFEKHVPPADGLAYFRADTAISADTIFDAFMKFLPDHQAYHDIRRDSTATTPMKTRALLDAIAGGRYIVYIDNLESIQHPTDHYIADEGIRQFIQTVLEAGERRGLSIIVTTRIPIPFTNDPPHLPTLLNRYHQLIRLDEGLPEADSIQFMREMDIQKVLPADNADLVAWHDKVKGFPRGLEALVGYLNSGDTHHIDDLLAVDVLEEHVLSHIVGVVIDALAPTYHQILATVVVIGQATSQADLEYALAPHTDTARLSQALERLVAGRYLAYNRQSRTYSLHPLDVDYVSRRLLPHAEKPPAPITSRYSTPKIRPADESAFTDVALNYRMAEFYKQKRKPESAWDDLPDLQPQLREMDYRFALGDADTTADILTDIDADYLFRWGYTTIALDWHTRLEGQIRNPNLAMFSFARLGYAYRLMGDAEMARKKYIIALNMAREQKDRAGEGAWLGNLGNAYANLGDIPQAIRHYEEALVIHKERGDKKGEGINLCQLADRYSELGEIDRAIATYQQAIIINREVNDKFYEGIYVGNLGNALTTAGRYVEAITHLRDAIAILTPFKAVDYLQANIGSLAHTYWLSGDIPNALKHIREAYEKYDMPTNNHAVSALRGCIAYCAGEKTEARLAWDEAFTHAETLLYKSPRQFEALYSRALALAGLWMVTGEGHYHADAIKAYTHAKAVCGYAGVLLENRQKLEALVRCAGVDDAGLLWVLV
jgi:tetratricopeptide (TPR) repeat protein